MPSTNKKSALDIIEAMLSCVQRNRHAETHAFLEESDSGAKLQKICLTDLTPNILLLGTDQGRKLGKTVCMSPLFATDGVYDQNRACDIVLIREAPTGLEVCYIELKSDEPSGYAGQFISTHCFMHYLVQLLKELGQIEANIIRERYVILHTDSSGKVPMGKKPRTRFSRQSANTPQMPDMHCVKNNGAIRCTQII